jgi:ParB-like chromosome segregation protein Spo0J
MTLSAPLDAILRDPEQPRKRFSQEAHDSLTENIWLHGLIHPIAVHPLEHGQYRLVAGDRRYLAFQSNQQRAAAEPQDNPSPHSLRYDRWTVIPITVLPLPESEVDLIMLRLAENNEREPLTLLETAAEVARALTSSGLPRTTFAERYRMSRALVQGYEACASATGPLRKALEGNAIHDARVAPLYLKLPTDLQTALVNQAMAEGSESSFITRRIVETHLRLLKEAETQKAAAAAAPQPKPPAPVRTNDHQDKPPADQALQPLLHLSTIEWLIGRLSPEPPSPEDALHPAHREALAALHETLEAGAPLILIREDPWQVPAGEEAVAAP